MYSDRPFKKNQQNYNTKKSYVNDVSLKDCLKNSDNVEGSPLEFLPPELLYIIIEKLDDCTFVNCLQVSEGWKNIALHVADADKSNLRWKSIFDAYQLESFRNKSSELTFRDIFANSLRWNLDLSISLFGSCLVKDIKKINIYQDNIIVIDSDTVTYFDVHTHDIRRQFPITYLQECLEFNETDSFVLTAAREEGLFNGCKLLLYGKSNPDDDKWLIRVINYSVDLTNIKNIMVLNNVDHYVIENNICYVIQACTRVLFFTIWHDNKWVVCNLGRYYGNKKDIIYAMNVLNTEIYILIKWGQMLHYDYDKRIFQKVAYVHMPQNKTNIVKMVHKYCLVVGVPGDCGLNVTRMRNNEDHTFYKLECPNLTCVTQHGEMLLMGYSDGIIQIFMPKAPSRENMLKRRIQISDYVSGPFEPKDLVVISIDVFEDVDQHYLFVATQNAVHQLLITHPDDTCLWNNIAKAPLYYENPIQSRYRTL